MKIRIYPTAEAGVWLALSGMGALVSLLSLRELRAGVEAIRKVALDRPHAQDVIRMAERNQLSELGRLVAQTAFCAVGLVSMGSRPPVTLGKPRMLQRAMPWVLVAVEAILVGNSVNEYMASRQLLRRRAQQTKPTMEGETIDG